MAEGNLPRRAAAILDFWLRGLGPAQAVPANLHRFWFGGDRATDRRIREEFGHDLETAGHGGCDSWTATAHGALALVILLDQFPRNIHRGTARAYAFDARAREIVLSGLDAGQDRVLGPVERAFFYMPLEHAEDLALQQRSVALFRDLAASAPPPLAKTCRSFLDYAVRHRDIIARFGRFPHRNAALGRSTISAETAFLEQPGSSF